jgi:diguanylate cyclase (GGDEF)-like protein
MAERIRSGLSEPLAVEGAHLVVTASIGLVVASEANCTAASLLRDADNAMYAAKREGRDQISLYRVNARVTANLKWGLSATRDTELSTG